MKLFFLDIDGTISTGGADPSPFLQNTISALQEQGDKVFICTGRTYEFTPDSVKALGCDGGIFSAGGLILNHGQLLFRAYMPEQMKSDALTILNELDANITLECERSSYWGGNPMNDILSSIPPEENLHSELQRLLSIIRQRLPMEQYRGEPTYKIVFLLPSREASEALKNRLPGGCNLVFFNNSLANAGIYLGEISDTRINKGIAMQQLCRHYGVTAADCVAYGDSMNDAQILQAAGEGVAMGNSNDEVKSLANRVCGNCAEDGLAIDLQRYLRREKL